MESKSLNKLGKFSFVDVKDRNNHEFRRVRAEEEGLVSTLRNAVRFCKKENGIHSKDLSKLGSSERESIENCLNENFLSRDPHYFGRRDVIYLDLY